ncbi:hypothetical protein [Pseudooceanicola nitratireducens]
MERKRDLSKWAHPKPARRQRRAEETPSVNQITYRTDHTNPAHA